MPNRPEVPRSPPVRSPATPDEDLDAGTEPERRRRPITAFVAVLAVLVATLLWFVATDDGARSVGAPSAEPTSASLTPEVPRYVGHKPSYAGPEVPVAPGRRTIRVEGVPLSFDIPADGWYRSGSLYLSKSPDDLGVAEALLYWTVILGGTFARPCGQWWGAPPGSTVDYARSASAHGGIEAPLPARHERVGGARGGSVAFRVVEDGAACQPGFFYRWRTSANSSWTGIEVGDVVQIWVVDIGPTRLLIEADTRVGAPSWLRTELYQIVTSIRFKPTTE
jgi:hypothetical protein